MKTFTETLVKVCEACNSDVAREGKAWLFGNGLPAAGVRDPQ